MLQVFMAPAIGCYCQVITFLVDQVSRDLDWWIFFLNKLFWGPMRTRCFKDPRYAIFFKKRGFQGHQIWYFKNFRLESQIKSILIDFHHFQKISTLWDILGELVMPKWSYGRAACCPYLKIFAGYAGGGIHGVMDHRRGKRGPVCDEKYTTRKRMKMANQ